jgi:hypothetical protein
MRDWYAYVQSHLGSLGVARVKQEDVVAELAAHLEELDGHGRRRRISSDLCPGRELEGVTPRTFLGTTERTMDERVKQIWIPSLVTLLSAGIALALLIWAGTQPVILHPGGARSVISYIPWLLGLPLIGAAGGYLSRRANGTGWRAYLAGTFPALAIARYSC